MKTWLIYAYHTHLIIQQFNKVKIHTFKIYIDIKLYVSNNNPPIKQILSITPKTNK